MARNRITGRETQKMQEYTQEQISQAERRGIEFPTDVKEQLFEYANLIGEEEKVRTLVRNLADAVIQADKEGVEDLLDDAKMDIQELPDPTIGKLELRDYGYTAEDMVPLRKEAALDYHRMRSKRFLYVILGVFKEKWTKKSPRKGKIMMTAMITSKLYSVERRYDLRKEHSLFDAHSYKLSKCDRVEQ